MAAQTQWDWRKTPSRNPKSLVLLGETEQGVVGGGDNSIAKEEKEEKTKTKKKTPKLNVSDKDSPYALIDKYFPERESYYFQNQNKFIHEYNKGGNKTDIGQLLPEEVWLSDG